METGTEAVEDHERLMRRVPECWAPTASVPYPQHHAFKPHKSADTTGLSVFREKHISPEQLAAKGREGKLYWIASVSAGDVRRAGLSVEPHPNAEDGPGHAEIPEMRSENRDSQKVREWTIRLAQHLCTMNGPFAGATPPPR